jgi:hypothetical protein
MKLLEKEDKSSRKCQKHSKIWKISATIVATMTPIVPRWDCLAPEKAEGNSAYF